MPAAWEIQNPRRAAANGIPMRDGVGFRRFLSRPEPHRPEVCRPATFNPLRATSVHRGTSISSEQGVLAHLLPQRSNACCASPLSESSRSHAGERKTSRAMHGRSAGDQLFPEFGHGVDAGRDCVR